ncbi:hypothetical protein DPMN_107698 [Dreissena polymorpha]|uniref:Uncharacterized protein n=1 Tax=Dreissena polymorpha TaxID=45954 RepID=A0A9D4QL69_DREPO|nr:hypothetical protein DPMN_107698 [Dreissena polymorpha]
MVNEDIQRHNYGRRKRGLATFSKEISESNYSQNWNPPCHRKGRCPVPTGEVLKKQILNLYVLHGV